jgi:ketosteroid isomerase-like protein
MDELQTWVEKLKIFELFSEYTLAFDRQDAEGIVNCFTADGVFGFGDRGLFGREKIREYARVHATIRSRHLTTSPVYRIDEGGESATGQSTVVMTIPTPSGYKVGFIGWYDDELRKVGGKWLISRRWVTDERLPEHPDLTVATADPDVAKAVQPLIDAYQRIGQKV